jgi:5-methylcytosine-specific restriction endonuclease McrA
MDGQVLVLNANFEPLNVCSLRRALGLMVGGKAELVLDGRGFVRTVRAFYPRPSIIRLGYMIRRPRPHVKLNKREIFRRDGHTCQYCGATVGHMTIDHVVPRRCGGEHTWANLVTACAACNTKKGGRRLEEAHMQLLRPPREPHASAFYLFGSYLNQNQEWVAFLEGW